jgi:hypothetical protein
LKSLGGSPCSCSNLLVEQIDEAMPLQQIHQARSRLGLVYVKHGDRLVDLAFPEQDIRQPSGYGCIVRERPEDSHSLINPTPIDQKFHYVQGGTCIATVSSEDSHGFVELVLSE